jgi:hypothetical protein
MINDTLPVKGCLRAWCVTNQRLSIMMSGVPTRAQEGWLELEQEQYNNAILASLSDMSLQRH